MAKVMKKLSALLLAFAMMITMMPALALEVNAESQNVFNVYVNGVDTGNGVTSEWLKENNKLPESYDSGFSSVVDSLRRMKEGSERKLLLDDVLKDFQKRGVEWLLDLKENELFGLLSDDMGLGKTLQVIAFLSELSVKKEKRIFPDFRKEVS